MPFDCFVLFSLWESEIFAISNKLPHLNYKYVHRWNIYIDIHFVIADLKLFHFHNKLIRLIQFNKHVDVTRIHLNEFENVISLTHIHTRTQAHTNTYTDIYAILNQILMVFGVTRSTKRIPAPDLHEDCNNGEAVHVCGGFLDVTVQLGIPVDKLELKTNRHTTWKYFNDIVVVECRPFDFRRSGSRFNIKITFCLDRNTHDKDKTAARPSNLMMTSSNENIFRITGHLCGEFMSPVNSPHKGQWRGALMFSLICVWINGWVNNSEAGDLRHHRAHYDVIVMFSFTAVLFLPWELSYMERSSLYWIRAMRDS